MELNIIKSKIGQLRTAEGQVKSLIGELVIAVTDRIHEHDDVDSANAFIVALTPLNQKKVLSWFKEHGGHKIQEGILTKRIKEYSKGTTKVDPYKDAYDRYQSFKDTGLNFWQWAVQNKPTPEAQVLTLEQLAKKARKLNESMKEALEANIIDRTQALQMLLGDVMSQEDLMASLAAMVKAEAAVSQIAMAATTKGLVLGE